MKAMKVEILVLSFDDTSDDEMSDIFEREFSSDNDMIRDVKKIESVDVGDWDDDHPLNKLSTCDQAYSDLFDKDKEGD